VRDTRMCPGYLACYRQAFAEGCRFACHHRGRPRSFKRRVVGGVLALRPQS
jgi:hypothetical protein